MNLLYMLLFLVSRNPAFKSEPAVYVVVFWCPGILPLRMNLLYMLLFLVSRNPASKNEPAVYVVVFWCPGIQPLRMNVLYVLFSFFGVQESCL